MTIVSRFFSFLCVCGVRLIVMIGMLPFSYSIQIVTNNETLKNKKWKMIILIKVTIP